MHLFAKMCADTAENGSHLPCFCNYECWQSRGPLPRGGGGGRALASDGDGRWRFRRDARHGRRPVGGVLPPVADDVRAASQPAAHFLFRDGPQLR